MLSAANRMWLYLACNARGVPCLSIGIYGSATSDGGAVACYLSLARA
jgi:hypothetical protein